MAPDTHVQVLLSPVYLGDSGLYPFTTGFTLMWEWGGANGLDVVTSSTQNMHSPYALNSDWENTEVL